MNTWRCILCSLDEIHKDLQRRLEPQSFSGPGIKLKGDGVQVVLTEHRQVSPLGHVLSQEAIGVLIDSSLPGAMWIGEVNRRPGLLGDLSMTHQLAPLIVGERLAHFQWYPVKGRTEALNGGGGGSDCSWQHHTRLEGVALSY